MKWLTKSDYLKFLIHPAYLWLQKYDKDRLPPFDEAAQALADQGKAVETYASQLFPPGKGVSSLFKQAVYDTDQLIRQGEQVIYQATVLTRRNLFAMADIIVKQPDGSWHIYEVKSSTKTRDSYIADLAFQRAAFEEYGYEISGTSLIHINSLYRRSGEIDCRQFLTVRDVTADVDRILPRTIKNIQGALDIMALPSCPDLDPTRASEVYTWMQIWRHLHPDLPAESIYNLCRLTPDQIRSFAKANITRITDVPALTAELKSQQITQIAVTKSGQPAIQKLKIAKRLDKLVFPLWFLDYETTFPAVPAHDGCTPYQQVPFQYSLHCLKEPGGELTQTEFLATGASDPMAGLLQQLQRDLTPTGSVIVWNKSFEMGVNDLMGRAHPEYADFLKDVNRRVYDLMDIFMDGLYAHPAFFGSASIKRVLPVLVPELSYKTLGIQEGMTASRKWAQAAGGQLSPEETELVYEDLRAYCGQDTLAMVRIYEVLRDAVRSLPTQPPLL